MLKFALIAACAVQLAAAADPKISSTADGSLIAEDKSGKVLIVDDVLTVERRSAATVKDMGTMLEEMKAYHQKYIEVYQHEMGLSRIIAKNYSSGGSSGGGGGGGSLSSAAMTTNLHWLAVDKSFIAMNEPAQSVHIVIPAGFESLYSPVAPPFFKCTFKASGVSPHYSLGTLVQVAGKLGGIYYSVQCDSPELVPKQLKYTVELAYEDASGLKALPYLGKKGLNEIEFDMIWGTYFKKGLNFMVNVKGLDTSKAYTCSFTDYLNKKFTKSNKAAFVKDGAITNRYLIDCGRQPYGFKIRDAKSQVTLSITQDGGGKVKYIGDARKTVISLDICSNGVKDGSETDVDCGGFCGATCGAKQKCASTKDCVAPRKCHKVKNICGAGGGLSKADPGDSCKQIKADEPQSKNGFYWVKGYDAVEVTPYRVYCWQADRQGGGWTLGIVNWYTAGKFPNSVAVGDTYDALRQTDRDVLGSKTIKYKLSDKQIWAAIGQKAGQKSKFEVMADQSARNTYYSATNNEYIILTNYNTAWHWTNAKPVTEALPYPTMTSYLWDGKNFDGKTPLGEGVINWQGKPNCARAGTRGGRAGVVCYGVRQGQNPNGGKGCKKDKSYNRWSGPLHFYMNDYNADTYLYICNGPQHSSSHRMSHRWWFRSDKSME